MAPPLVVVLLLGLSARCAAQFFQFQQGQGGINLEDLMGGGFGGGGGGGFGGFGGGGGGYEELPQEEEEEEVRTQARRTKHRRFAATRARAFHSSSSLGPRALHGRVLCAQVDLYERMDLQPEASDREIKQAYRKLSVKYHPDKNSGAEVRSCPLLDS